MMVQRWNETNLVDEFGSPYISSTDVTGSNRIPVETVPKVGIGLPAQTVRLTDEREGVGEGYFAQITDDHFLQTQTFGQLMMYDVFHNNIYDTSYRWSEIIAGSATSSISESKVSFNVTTSGSSSIISKFKQLEMIGTPFSFRRYITRVQFGTERTNNIKEWGLKNNDNTSGIFLRLNGSDLRLVTLKSGSETLYDLTAQKPNDGLSHFYEFRIRGTNKFDVYLDLDTEFFDSTEDASTVDYFMSDKELIPFFAHYNSGSLSGPASPLITSAVALFDLASSSIGLVGEDENNNRHPIRADTEGKLIVSTSGALLFHEEFKDNTIETVEKWQTDFVTGGSYVISNSILNMSTTTTASSEAELFSRQRFTCGLSSGLKFIIALKFGDTGKSNHFRMFGLSNSDAHTEGYYFELINTTFYATSMFNGTPNRKIITSHLPTDGNYHIYKLVIVDGLNVNYYIDDIKVAHIHGIISPLTSSKDLNVHLHMENEGGAASSTSNMYISSISLSDEGQSSIQLMGASTSSPTMLIPVQVDSLGRLITASSASLSGATSGMLNYDVASKGPLVTNIWERVLTYPIPTGKTFNLIQFQSAAANNTQVSRCVRQITFGTKNYATSYTTANTLSSPQFASKLYALVTTTHSTTTTILTATYVNQDGVSGRTATTATIPSAAPGTTMYEFTLQAGDFGVQSVSAVSHTNVLTGIDAIIGIDELGYHRDKNADFVTESVVGGQAIIVNSGNFGTIGLDFNSTNTTVARLIKALFFLSNT
jgi:hypothetical protein